MSIVVREAKIGDEPSIAAIHVAAWRRAYVGIMSQELLDSLDINQKRDMWRDTLEHPGKGSYIVSEVNGVIEGFSVFGPARDQDINESEAAEIVAINVNPEKWRLGLGSALLQHVVDRAATNGNRAIYLWVASKNTRAIKFYSSHAFSCEGRTKYDPKHSSIEEVRYVRRIG
jgi:ribosomal protein S18 acetylase RimI-like enzyme